MPKLINEINQLQQLGPNAKEGLFINLLVAFLKLFIKA